MSDRKVKAIRCDGEITKAVLVEVGSDPNLEGYMVLCKWKDEGFSVGWSNMKDDELAFCKILMDREISDSIFGERQ